tara:strand:- start:13 stop:528 length:516 start_codon:yes stop_codon:yes gene_type:complete
MSLVNLTAEAVEASTLLDPILYDSGWKRVVGTGGTFEIEALTYKVDSVVRVFGRMYKDTQANEWRLFYDSQDNMNNSFHNWVELSRLDSGPRTGSSNFIAGVDYQIQIGNQSMNNTNTTNPHNASGYSLMAGKQVIFKCNGAQSSEGIEYRIVVERSTSAVMLSRSLGKSQ